MADPLIQTAKMPTSEERQRTEKENEKFQKEQQIATPEKTQEMKKNTGKFLGQNFDPHYKEIIKTKLKVEKYESDTKIQEYLNFPQLRGLHDNKKINDEAYIQILKQINDSPEKEINIIVSEISSDIEDDESRENLVDLFDETDNEKTNKENSHIEKFNDMISGGSVEGLEVLEKFSNPDKTENNLEDSIFQDVYNLIGSNYIEIQEDTGDHKEDVQIAIETSANEIVNKYPSIKKYLDTQMYKNAFSDIKSGDIKNGVEGVKNLLLLGSTIALAGRDKNSKAVERVKKEFENRIKTIESEILELQNQLIDNPENRKNIEEKIDNLKTEKEEIVSGEVFKDVGKIEVNPSNAESGINTK